MTKDFWMIKEAVPIEEIYTIMDVVVSITYSKNEPRNKELIDLGCKEVFFILRYRKDILLGKTR